MKFVHRIIYFIKFFLFIFCPFTNHLHAPLMQYHTNPSILKKCLFDTDSHAFLFTFRFDPKSTHYRLRSSMVCNTIFLAPLAIGQRAYVMVRCPSCLRPSVPPSVRALTFSLNIFFTETTYRILMKFHRNVPTMVLFRIS